MRVSVTVSGDKELAGKAHCLAAVITAQNLAAATQAGALLIANEAKRRSPVKTGTLRRSIHIQLVSSSADRASVDVGTDVKYARRIEYGFTAADSLGRRFHQPARAYLRPAFDTTKAAAAAEMARVLKVVVERAAS